MNFKTYFQESSDLIKNLYLFSNELTAISDSIYEVYKKNKKVLVAGNGGSSADADHFVGELVCTFKEPKRNPISAISLSCNPAALTAWSNDFGFNSYFQRQVQAHGAKGDILILLSTGGGNVDTGASMSLVKAAEEALKKKMIVISFVGKSGGELKKISNILIHIQNNNTALIQESHMALLHCICVLLETKLS
jgi:D-sedoheptulose 7-phosphate isomerase